MATSPAPQLRTSFFRQALLVSGLFVVGLIIVNFVFFSPSTVAVVLLSGLYQGMLFFLVAAGMSIVFGLLDVLNLAQGAFFMLGAYGGFAIYGALPEGTPVEVRFVAALVGAALIGAALGALTETILLRPLYARPVFQIVLTFGLSTAMVEVVRALYGPAGLVPVEKPAALDTTFNILGGSLKPTACLSSSSASHSWWGFPCSCSARGSASSSAPGCRIVRWCRRWASTSAVSSRSCLRWAPR